MGHAWTHVTGLELLQGILDGKIERLFVVADLVSSFILAQRVGFITRSVLSCDDLGRKMVTLVFP
jgi:hypothetical protein